MTATYNPVLGRDPWTALATFTADSAAAGYPASNLASSDLNQVWRSTATTAEISFTLSRALPVGFVAMLRHNMSQGATFRLRLYSDAAWTTLKYDSSTDTALVGGQDVWPVSYSFSQLDFEDDNWITWQYRSEQLTGQAWDRPVWLTNNRYLVQSGKLTLTNTFNSAGYVQVGRLEIARGYQLTRGIALQSASGYAPNSIVSQADGGKEYGQLRMKPKVFQGTFPSLPRDESELVKDLKRQHDVVPEQGIFWHPFPTDPTLWLRNSFYARFADLGLHQIANPVRDAVPISLRENM